MDPTKDSTKSRGEVNEPMRFANATLGQHRHVCAFFHDTEEEYRDFLRKHRVEFDERYVWD